MPVNHFIIGTAGHIDHGKTALVKALTGVDTDRLAEEKRRGVSIDLGFAPLFLPSGVEASIVDVPGHERFVKNMLAGSTGIDFLLLVVAADDGIMEQTVEHLSIAELLGVQAAVVAITKIDAVSSSRVVEVEVGVREWLKGTKFGGAPIVAVSALKNRGLEDLIAELEVGARLAYRRSLDLPVRLPIDRSFIMSGAGRVVTGTLWSGVLTVTGPVELLPTKETVRVRRIEVHGNQVNKALAGQRVAVNIVVPGRPPQRGDMLAPPGAIMPATELIAQVSVLAHSKTSLTRRSRLLLFHGTKETPAAVKPIGVSEIKPGSEGYVRLVLAEAVAAVFRDRFVLRRRAPLATIAGGMVLLAGRSSRPAPVELSHLNALASGDDCLVIRALLRSERRGQTGGELAQAAQLSDESARTVIDKLVEEKEVAALSAWRRTYYADRAGLAKAAAELAAWLRKWHLEHPYQFGPQKEAVKALMWPELSSSQADILFSHYLDQRLIVKEDNRLALAERLNDPLEAKVRDLDALVAGFSPPTLVWLGERLGLEPHDLKSLLARAQASGLVVEISPDLYFSVEAVNAARDVLIDYLAGAGEITVAKFKELLGTTRKYAVPLMEQFDREKITRRAGDIRVIFDPIVED